MTESVDLHRPLNEVATPSGIGTSLSLRLSVDGAEYRWIEGPLCMYGREGTRVRARLRTDLNPGRTPRRGRDRKGKRD